MSRFEQVRNDLWNDAPFCDASAAAKYLYLWSFLNPLCSMSGIYRARREIITLDTGLSSDAVVAALAELETHGMVACEDGFVWVCARAKRLKTRTPQMAKSVARDVADLAPTHPLRVGFLERYGDHSWLRDELRPLVEETFGRGSREGHPTLTAFPVVEGNPVTLDGPSPEGPLPMPLPSSAEETEAERRAREAEADVWTHYVAVVSASRPGRPPTFDERRRAIVRDALAVRSIAECKRAIDGLACSAYHRGENPQGVPYLDIRYALKGNFRDRESNEARIDHMAAHASAVLSRPGVRPNLTAAQLVAADRAAREAREAEEAAVYGDDD